MSTFKVAVDKTETKPVEFNEPKSKTVTSIANVEVPYTEYGKQNGTPFIVDHYKLGSFWDESGAYEKEVGLIDGYIKHKIDSGEWADNQTTVKNELKKMEKLTNIKDEQRASIKISTIGAYIKFLMESEGIRKDFAKYGNK